MTPRRGMTHEKDQEPLSRGEQSPQPEPLDPRVLRSELPPASWSNLEVVAALLSYLYRIYDGGGISSGRSWESSLLEPAQALLWEHRPSGDIATWPNREAVIDEARQRQRLRVRTHAERLAGSPGSSGIPKDKERQTATRVDGERRAASPTGSSAASTEEGS